MTREAFLEALLASRPRLLWPGDGPIRGGSAEHDLSGWGMWPSWGAAPTSRSSRARAGHLRRAAGVSGTSRLNLGVTSASLGGNVPFTASAVASWTGTTPANAYVFQQRDSGGDGYLGQWILRLDSGRVNGTIYTTNNTNEAVLNEPGGPAYNDGKPHLLTLIRNPATLRAYLMVDSKIVAESAIAGYSLGAHVGIHAAYDQRDNTGYFSGVLGPWVLWHRALSPNEIRHFAHALHFGRRGGRTRAL